MPSVPCQVLRMMNTTAAMLLQSSEPCEQKSAVGLADGCCLPCETQAMTQRVTEPLVV